MSRKTSDLYEELSNEEKEYIQTQFSNFLIDPNLSNEIVAEKISEKTKLKINRKGVVRVMEYLNFPKRTKEMIDLSRTTISQKTTNKTRDDTLSGIINKTEKDFTKEQLQSMYDNNSIEYLSEILEISDYYVVKVLEHQGIELREYNDYFKVIETYKKAGYTIEDMKEAYLSPDKLFKDFMKYIYETTGILMTQTSIYRMLNHLDIVKPQELIAYAQGGKSRKILLENLNKLKSAGFDSREDLAQYFHDNKRLTYKRLVKELNKSIGEDLFSYRWLERHMTPYMPADRLVGVSRGELGLLEFIKTFYNGEVITGDRQIIRPKELDIVLPELKLAIEFNGDYWHSDKFIEENHGMTSFEYHARKQHDARLQGYSLVFVWESDWEGNADAVESSVERFILSGGSQVDSSLLRLS